ncbi:MAG: hypothetical protein Q9190_006363, partial [Brigantiaea leucoxantha]
MSSRTCWRCLSPASMPLPSHTAQFKFLRFPTSSFAPFSTTTVNLANPPKKKSLTPGARGPPKKGQRATFRRSSGSGRDRGRRPAPGERKAMRKRIVLSNANALAVELSRLAEEDIHDEEKIGQMVSMPDSLVDQLRNAEAFKATQGWGFFRHPSMLMRKETVEVGQLIHQMSEEDAQSRRTVRRILVGDRGSGKSMMLLQTMAAAFLKGWTVINIPE